MVRRALGLSPKYAEHSIQITSDDNCGVIRSQKDGVAVEYRFPSHGDSELITIPIAIFADCEAARDDPVKFSKQTDDSVLVEWQNKGVPILRTANQSECDDTFPPPPESWLELSDKFLPALAAAMATTDREATRYSVDCVQLCGNSGRILATDSRQALIISGFEFPWEDQILLPWNGVFGLKELASHGPIQVGRNDTTLSFSTGPWTLHFSLETERRFPRIDDCIPESGSEKTTLTITDVDAVFAATAIKSLTKAELDNSVTVDLNGAVRIRAKGDGPSTELVLSNSQYEGKSTWFVSDRDILRHGLQLGFRQFRIVAPNKVIASEENDRTFLWMPIEMPGPLAADADTVRLESPVNDAATETTPIQTRSTNNTMAKNRLSQNGQADANGRDTSSGSNGIDLLIERAEHLKTSLRETQSDINDLISGLKQHRQQTKKLRSAVLTLKQLQAIEA